MSSTSSKIPVPVSSRGTSSPGLLSSVPSSPEHFYHHPHYHNHRSSPSRTPVQHSSSVPTGSGIEARLSPPPSNHHHQHHHHQQVKLPLSAGVNSSAARPRFEAYMMTGDLIINLANTKSSDNLLFGHSVDDRYNFRHKRQRTTPNLHSTTLNVYRHENLEGSTSLPSSPAEPLKSDVVQNDNHNPADVSCTSSDAHSIKHDSPGDQATNEQLQQQQQQQQQQQPQQQQNFNVRLSRSEDQLMKGALTAVGGFEEIDDATSQSNSVDTLLNNSNVNEVNKKESSSSSSSNYCSSVTTTCSSSSPTNVELDNHVRGVVSLGDGRVVSCKQTSSAEDEESLVTNTNSSIQSSSDSSGSYTATTTAATPTEGIGSYNGSPTKAVSTATTGTQVDQTESSMSEGYSMLSSLSVGGGGLFGSHHPQPKQYRQPPASQLYQKHMNSLSLSSSCESSHSSSPMVSPHDEEAEADTSTKLQTTLQVVDKSSGRSSATEIAPDNDFSDINASPRHQIPGGGVGDDCHGGSARYPSFITPNKRSECDDVQSLSPPPLPNGPPPSLSTSSSENDSGSEDEMELLSTYHYSPPKSVDTASACRLAKRLYNLEGFKKSDVSRHLSKNNDFSRAVAEEYLKYFDFVGDTLDGALRKFLEKFCLIGETQERERVLVHFSKHYLECNHGNFKSYDAVHTLTCALMLLNTDLHGENVGRKMTCGEFVENLAGLNDGDNFPREVLRSLYQSIKNKPLEWATDEDLDHGLGNEKKPSGNGNTPPANIMLGHNPFLDVPNPNIATEYKKGYIMRKCCFDANGKRTPLGKRGWKMFYATLRDMVLYLHKDEHGFRKNQLYESLHNSIRIHHSLATKATDYTKKQFVFRLQTADGAEYLFQTSDARELQAWIDKINFVAASLSAPPLPSAVGSQTKKFQKPLLPVNHTKYNLRDQLIDHENRKLRLEQELEEHLTTHVDKASRRFLSEFAEKESYLQYELKRYQEYINLLQRKIQQMYGNQALESIRKSATISSSKSKPLTTLSIGEEVGDDNDDEEGVPIIKPKSFRCRRSNRIRGNLSASLDTHTSSKT